jgi:UDP-glucose 4-epimerase
MFAIDDISNKKVIVTGASGFIGSHLCMKLQELKCEVHGITRDILRIGNNAIYWWQSDLSDLKEVTRLIESIGPDIIYHLSSFVTGSRSLDVVTPTFRSNLLSTLNLLTACSTVGSQRILLMGSMEEPLSDTTYSSSISPYASSKWASSIYARMFHKLYDLPVVILHVFMVYGPGQMDFKKLVPYVILSLLQGEKPKLTSGDRKVDWIYIDDVIEAMIAGVQVRGIEGKTIEVGSGELISIRNIVEILISMINPKIIPAFGAIEDRPFENMRVADTARSLNQLGWKSKMQIQRGMEKTVRWYRDHIFNKSNHFSIKKKPIEIKRKGAI